MLTSARGPWNMMFSEIVFWHETAEKIAQLCLVYSPCSSPRVVIHLRERSGHMSLSLLQRAVIHLRGCSSHLRRCLFCKTRYRSSLAVGYQVVDHVAADLIEAWPSSDDRLSG